jgi:hypothetical protein
LVALGVNSSGSDGMYFSSRETADKPQLILSVR